MKTKYLIVVDVQNDFVTGALGTEEARRMLPALLKKTENFSGEIWVTQDTHGENYLDTQEGKMLPVPHCILGTAGWELTAELKRVLQNREPRVYRKSCFGSVEMVRDLKKLYEQDALESVELVGVCTDICVISNALMIRSAMPELPVYADAACCAGVTPEKHRAALQIMESCQVRVRH